MQPIQTGKREWRRETVSRRLDKWSYAMTTDEGRTYRRNRQFFRETRGRPPPPRPSPPQYRAGFAKPCALLKRDFNYDPSAYNKCIRWSESSASVRRKGFVKPAPASKSFLNYAICIDCWKWFQRQVALMAGSVPRRIVPKLRQCTWLFIFDNQRSKMMSFKTDPTWDRSYR